LNGTLFKGVFIKLPANAPEIWKVRQWCRNSNADNVKNLEAYCFEHAAVYDDFDEEWIRLNEVLQRLPANSGNNEAAVKSYKFLESRDNAYHYFVSAKEIVLEGTVSPFETVKNDILYIILNKRKIMLINELEMNIYSDAQNHEYFTIYQK
jgi:hypothetical protein